MQLTYKYLFIVKLRSVSPLTCELNRLLTITLGDQLYYCELKASYLYVNCINDKSRCPHTYLLSTINHKRNTHFLQWKFAVITSLGCY